MKEFDKWWEPHHKIACLGKEGHDKMVSNMAWRAALKWVLNDCTEHEYYFDYDLFYKEDVEKELKEQE